MTHSRARSRHGGRVDSRTVDRTALAALADFNESYLTRNRAEHTVARLQSRNMRARNGHSVPILGLNTTSATT